MPSVEPGIGDFGELEARLEQLGWDDLMSGRETALLEKSLTQVAGVPVAIVMAAGEQPVAPIRHQLQTVAWVSADLDTGLLQGLARTAERVLYQASRYYLAANLHLDVVQRNYQELQQQHARLQASEARYRELSEQLEERVQAQVAQIEDRQRRLYASEKLNAVGRLGAGVAHEINNPIGFIRSNLNSARDYLGTFAELSKRLRTLPGGEELARELDLDFVVPDFQDLIDESIDGSARVAAIVSALRRFAGTDESGVCATCINELLQGVWAVAEGSLGEMRVDWALDESVPPVELDRAGISQAFYNLMENASLAAERPVGLVVETEGHEQGVRVRIRDDGDGMAPEVLARAFDPFYTTRSVGAGTGLGLSVCRDTIRAHGGGIDISSEPGSGTVVSVWLPGNPPAGES
ncbi:ATP-binding protein [Halovibrio salipaludis]|uniref:histidine kinase n=1 Tax=Halovibrio salipaludis TaxID=2032626 RepID=A0A2A2F8B0_9GAMM|nr:ATP-binding protein [Halovibrio salipaludis]PAU81771.1 ATP-binding protein [Halovibrio salipaludis]